MSSHGSEKTLQPHVDMADLPLFNNYLHPSVISPDTLSLFCIKQDKTVPTDLIKLDDVLLKLNMSTIEVLMMPIFKIERAESFIVNGKNSIMKNKPILEKDNYGNFVSRFNAQKVFCDYDIGKSAINAFKKALSANDIINSFYLQQGDFLLFKNKRLLHSRKHFTPRFDGHDTWLIRIFSLYQQPDVQILLSNKDITHLNTEHSAFSATPAVT